MNNFVQYNSHTSSSASKRTNNTNNIISLIDEKRILNSQYGPFYVVEEGNGVEKTYEIGKQLERYLTRAYLAETEKILKPHELKDIERYMDAVSCDKEYTPMYLRIGQSETQDQYYIDLHRKDSQVVQIDSRGWKLIENSPVYFRKPDLMGEQVLPVQTTKNLENLLRPFLNVEEEDVKAIIGWIIGAHLPNGPFPLLAINGSAGSGKSNLTRILQSLVDPSRANPSTLQKSEQDLAISSTGSWLLAFDNMVRLKDNQSDWFCRMATGGSFRCRKLYSDTEEIVINVCRPVIFNGIDAIIGKRDLLDRSMVVKMKPIPKAEKKQEKDFWAEFDEAKPEILGAIYNCISAILNNRGSVVLAELERMADFVMSVTEASSSLGWTIDTFQQVYIENQRRAKFDLVEFDPVPDCVIKFLGQCGDKWQGTATELFQKCGKMFRDSKPENWPKASHIFSGRVNSNLDLLKESGIIVDSKRSSSKRELILTRIQNGE